MTSLTQSIAGFAAGFSRQDIPAASITLAREAFIDLLGVMLAGAGEPVVPILKAVTAGDTAGPPCSLLLDAGQRRSATAAALVNGTAAHALDFDDVQFNAHPSTVLVPAILAEAERSGASGLKALQAYVLGYEVWGELHSREKNSYHDKGWHPTAVMGPMAATAAAAFLRGLDAGATRVALSLAASFTGGVVANFGSMAKPMHAGRAASSAIHAVNLAEAGFTAGEDGIGAPDGLLAALSPHGSVNRDAATGLGSRWFSTTTPLIFKKYPVCFSSHRPIDAILDLARDHKLRAQDVAQVDVAVRGTQARVLRFERPQTALEAKFSMQFAVACALLRGRVGLVDLDDAFVAGDAVQSMFGKVRFTHLPLNADGSPPLADRVVLTTVDGRVLDSGELARAKPHTRLKEKFLDCCEAGGFKRGEALFSALSTLETLPDMRQLCAAPATDKAAHDHPAPIAA
ncbi:MAG: MmgE/PrpD family protein [Rhodoferax sp.]|jgi:2-methylcitrate dehydratase PrpD|nr:MmgE/PrpD family protein [Rhodoferax sp.]MCB2031146.1 MmgE/PrpD family protein [Rhodoferax sp.]MCB2044434.1 MmgE/PrpD family protein [Rhodoferax sp.]